MAKKKPPFKFLLSLLFAFPTILRLAKNVFTLIKIEAQESCASFAKIVLLAIFTLIVLSSTWLSLLAILFFYLIEWHWSIPGALGIILLLNVLIVLLLALNISRNKKRLFFPETRRHLNL